MSHTWAVEIVQRWRDFKEYPVVKALRDVDETWSVLKLLRELPALAKKAIAFVKDAVVFLWFLVFLLSLLVSKRKREQFARDLIVGLEGLFLPSLKRLGLYTLIVVGFGTALCLFCRRPAA